MRHITRSSLTIILAATLGVLAAACLLLWAFTRPGFTTPLAERIASMGTGHTVTIDRAWVSYTPAPQLHIRRIDVPDRLQMEIVDIVPNLFGLLPGIALVDNAHAENGSLIIDRASGSSQTTNFETYIDRVSLSDLDVTIRRDAAVSRFTIVDATGSLRGGGLTIEAIAGDGRVHFEGDGRLARLDTIEGRVRVEGPNLARVASALGIAAPDVPPFTLQGDLALQPDAWLLTGLTGEIGDSDIAGSLTIEFGQTRPNIVANLTTRSLDFDDLGVMIGLPSRNEDGAALNEAQSTAIAKYQTSGRFIPDAAIDMSRLGVVDATVTYRAREVIDAPLAITRFMLDLNLQSGRLTINDLRAQLANGSLRINGVLDANNDPARTDLQAWFNNLSLEAIVPNQNALGKLEGRASLALTGSDFRTAFANSNGTIDFWAEDARVAAMPVEAVDLDMGEMFVMMLDQSPGEISYVDAPCMVARLDVRDGIGTAAPFILDTDDSLIVAKGEISLRDETLNLDMAADAKDFSWGTVLGDVNVGGQWRDPNVSVNVEEAAVQGLLAGILGSIAGPLGALPFIESGDGENAPCAELLVQARSTE